MATRRTKRSSKNSFGNPLIHIRRPVDMIVNGRRYDSLHIYGNLASMQVTLRTSNFTATPVSITSTWGVGGSPRVQTGEHLERMCVGMADAIESGDHNIRESRWELTPFTGVLV